MNARINTLIKSKFRPTLFKIMSIITLNNCVGEQLRLNVYVQLNVFIGLWTDVSNDSMSLELEVKKSQINTGLMEKTCGIGKHTL